MATVTVTVTLRRTEGRTPADLDSLARAVIDELESCIGAEVEAKSLEDDALTYEITNVGGWSQPRLVDLDVIETDRTCPRCQNAIPANRIGQPRRYCSDACRQAAYRDRQQ